MAVVVDAPALAAELRSANPPVLLDVRWSLGGPPGRPDYDAGHLPDARYVDLDTDLSAPPSGDGSGGRHPLPSTAQFEAAMRRVGVCSQRPVVVYGHADGWGPARAWWCLRYFGHTDVRVLDGGFPAWKAAGLPVEVTTEAAHSTGSAPAAAAPELGDGVTRADAATSASSGLPEPVATEDLGDFVARPGGMPLLDADAAAELARSAVLLDARAEARYRGETEPVDPAAGHIPGAINAATTNNLGTDGRLRPAEELRRRFADLGASTATQVGVYCGSGVSAAHEVLALEVTGITAALYAGSWSDWCSNPDRPVATGPAPG